ncbi:glycoside hydrolase family 3 protein [Nocardioides albus]|uniref:Beta-N-acetylhexosaminidase n=1 Tax=Nocardioides albus TaxID=1841 RepID=A0A7W5F9R3_9ACTN|nr:glycoside hydrolase family 3 N-terminal domain-containing protein [Nocardioides albus]MBB3090579.1 beta-N-acetylhexosaminidase [Nocardioides albus]GGU24901.1 sugar hydrolase [Nocardioides albus]
MPPSSAVETLALRVQVSAFAGATLPADHADLLREGLGGICLFGSNTEAGEESVRSLAAEIRSASAAGGWAPVITIDEEGGDVTRLEALTGSSVLGAAALGAADDLALTEETGQAVGSRLAWAGINLDLAPVADVNSNPDNPVIATRSFSHDAGVAAKHVAAWVRGLQTAGVAACVKHFPGHGDTGQDSHVALPVLDVSLDTLRDRELVPFLAAAEAGVASVMTSHIVVPALDPELPGTLSAPVLGLLRELGYDGPIVSDALDMAGASAQRGIPAAAVLSLAAGADLLVLGPDKPASLVRDTAAAIVAAVESGELPLERLQDAVARVDRLLADFPGTQQHPETDPRFEQRSIEGARRALATASDLAEIPDLTGARVVTIDTEANIAVGDVPWGLPPDVVLRPGEPLPDLPDAPLIVQVRDAHRRPDVGRTVAQLRSAAVLVEWGWPGAYDGQGLPRLCPQGFSLPGVTAVTEMLQRSGWDPTTGSGQRR